MSLVDPERKRVYNQRYYARQKKHHIKTNGVAERKVPMSCRIPETLAGRLQRVTLEGVATGRYPWRTFGEAVTVLLNLGFTALKGDPFIDEMIPHLEMSQHLDRLQTQRREAQATLNKARTEIAELLSIGADVAAVAYFHATMEAARKMPPTQWRDWLIAQLRKAFPELLKQKPRGVVLMAPKRKQRSVA